MKKLILLIAAGIITASLSACGTNNPAKVNPSPTISATPANNNKDTNLGDDVGNAVEDVTQGAGNAVKDVGQAVDDAGNAVDKGVKDATNANK